MNRPLTLAALGLGAWWVYRTFAKPSFSFAGKNVLLTGGSRGLGLVIARQLIDARARVAICSRDADELRRAADDLQNRGGEVLALRCDVTDRESVEAAVGLVEGRMGPIDVLINNAGVIGVGPLETMDLGDFEQAMKTHFWGSLHTVLAVLPSMRRWKRGRIVNISSIGGKVAIPHLLPYTASKFALVGLSSGLRNELAGDGIVVTTVCPGLMRTGSHVNAEFHGQHDKEYAWFALGDAMPLMSTSAESAASSILAACARGDAELVLTLPAKLAVILNALVPSLMSGIMSLVDRLALPGPGGIGKGTLPGKQSRGVLPDALTANIDAAADRNNERGAIPASQLAR
jgi:NAD(P)-dependent dehydrogenase (short-subunit alcohol dehydrogenase family)